MQLYMGIAEVVDGCSKRRDEGEGLSDWETSLMLGQRDGTCREQRKWVG